MGSMKYLAALLALLIPSLASAQSSPGFIQGQIPSASQWNSYFASKANTISPTMSNPNVTGQLNIEPVSIIANGWLSAVRQVQTFTGTDSKQVVMNQYLSVDSLAMPVEVQGVDVELIKAEQDFGGPAMTGTRNAVVIAQKNTGGTGNSSVPPLVGTPASALQIYTTITANDGGTLARPASTEWAINTVQNTTGVGTIANAQIGMEMDEGLDSTVNDLIGITINEGTMGGTVLRDHAAIQMIGNTQLTLPGSNWLTGLQFGAPNSGWAFNNASTLIGAVDNIQSPICTRGLCQALNGIDLHLVTFSGSAIITPGATLSGTGAWTATQYTATAMPTSCSGQATGTLWNSSGVVHVC